MLIRDIQAGDRPQWEILWRGYQNFYNVSLPDKVTERSFTRFLDSAEPVFAMVAEAEGQLLGLVHYLFHRNTWCLDDVCYLEDLFTLPEARGKGVARALIEAIYAKAQARGAERVYWMTQETNKTAQALYDKLAVKPGLIQYRKTF